MTQIAPASIAKPPRASNRGSHRVWTVVRWLSPLFVLLLWQLGSAIGLIPQDVAPAPSLVFEAGLETIESGELSDALTASGWRVIQGLLLGGLIGVALGVLVGLSRIADSLLDPSLQMVRALPHLALIAPFILWFGIGETPKILMIALGVMFPLYLNTISAIRQIEPKLLETGRVLGFGAWQRFRIIILPSAAPQVLVGLRQSLAIAWLTLIVAEQIAGGEGIGFMINNARDFLRMDIIFFGLVIYALLGFITDAAVRQLERYALRYRPNNEDV